MDNEEPLSAAKGCLVGLVLAVPVWAVVIWLAVEAIGRDE